MVNASLRVIPWFASTTAALAVSVALAAEQPADPKAAERQQRVELRDAASTAYKMTELDFQVGSAKFEDVARWSTRWVRAELALAETAEAKRQAVQEHEKRLLKLQKGVRSRMGMPAMEYFLLQAERLRARDDRPAKALYERNSIERRALQGEWRVVSEELGGHDAKRADWGFARFNITGRFGEFGDPHSGSWGMVTIAPQAKPPQFDVYGFNDDFVYGFEGIYRLKDDDLTLCFDPQHRKRPAEFSSQGSDTTTLYKLKRVKEEDKPANR